METYSLTLSTLQPNGILNKTNMNNVTFNVNWDEIFGSRTGTCNVRAFFITNSVTGTTTFLTAPNQGSIRASFNSQYSQNSYGVNLGLTTLLSSCMICDTISTNGVTIQIPKGNSAFTINLIDRSENYMVLPIPAGTNAELNWTIQLCFDVYK